jgi:hypothetical protein
MKKIAFSLLALTVALRGETLTNTKGKSIDVEILDVTASTAVVRVKGGAQHEINFDTLEPDSVKKLKDFSARKAKAEAELKAKEAERDKELAGSLEFRGLRIGMTIAEADKAIQRSKLYWITDKPKAKGEDWSPIGYDPDAPEDVRQAFKELARAGDGTSFRYGVLEAHFLDGVLYKLKAIGPEFKSFDPGILQWIEAVKVAVDAKYKIPKIDEKLTILDMKRGYSTRRAKWLVDKQAVELRVTTTDSIYQAEVDFFDSAVVEALEKKNAEIKSGL